MKPYLYSLWFNGKRRDMVASSIPLNDAQVREKALRNHDRAPCIYAEFPWTLPFEHRHYLEQATVIHDKD